MQGLNHVVFGSIIGLSVTQPALAVPLALASHFALDTVPHYGEHHRTARGTTGYHLRIAADAVVSLVFMLCLLSLNLPNPALVITCALVAVLPDFLWPLATKIKQSGPLWEFFKFHKGIQHESPWGIYIEVIWFIATCGLAYWLAVY